MHLDAAHMGKLSVSSVRCSSVIQAIIYRVATRFRCYSALASAACDWDGWSVGYCTIGAVEVLLRGEDSAEWLLVNWPGHATDGPGTKLGRQ